MRVLLFNSAYWILVAATGVQASDPPAANNASSDAAVPQPRKLVLSFSSLRERPAFANLYSYEHDGVRTGTLRQRVPAEFERSDTHSTLSANGHLCAYAAKQVGGFTPLVILWNRREMRPLPELALNKREGSRIEPALSGDGHWLVLCSRGHAGSLGGWDLQLFSLPTGTSVPIDGINSEFDEREVAVDRSARLLAFVTNHPGGAGLSDVRLYDRTTSRFRDLRQVNSASRELNPALSADGRYLAFVSDRPGGAGGKDVYLYDVQRDCLVELPGLNSVAHEQTPALSPDGRYLAFVSERSRGAGERDIYLYDRATSQLLETPELNSPQEDFDPSLAYDALEDVAEIK
jgi:WD40-like Beta Propeller Repeat